MESKVRLNLFIATYSSLSRRKADLLIKERKVRVNGHIQCEMPFYVDPKKDIVKVQSKILKPITKFVYIAFHKPEKTLTTADDPINRRTIYHFLNRVKYPVFPVGRLDWNTEGLLLLTNDGTFADRVMSPKHKILKTYMVKLDRVCPADKLEKLKMGVTIPGGRVRAIDVHKKERTWVRITIGEGKNRQLHYMFGKLGFIISKLRRVSIGGLHLKTLKKGEGKYLTTQDIDKIFKKPRAITRLKPRTPTRPTRNSPPSSSSGRGRRKNSKRK